MGMGDGFIKNPHGNPRGGLKASSMFIQIQLDL